MQPEMVRISRDVVERMILQLDRSATLCENARSMSDEDLRTDLRPVLRPNVNHYIYIYI